MSQDEVELRDLISEKLTSSGFMYDIKAQIRAAVLLTLSQDVNPKIPIVEHKTRMLELSKEVEGNLSFALVQDFLQRMQLKHTLSIFQLEAGLDLMNLKSRTDVMEEYSKDNKSFQDDEPLLYGFVKQPSSQGSSPIAHNNLQGLNRNNSSPIMGSNSPRSKRMLPQVQDQKLDEIEYKSDDGSAEFSDIIGLPDSSRTNKNDSAAVVSPYQAPQIHSSASNNNNDYSYDESFNSDKSITPRPQDKSDQEDSIKEIDIEEIDEKSESRTNDITLDSDRSLSFDYVENLKIKN